MPEYWLVDPAKHTLEVYVLRGAQYVLSIACDEHDDFSSPTLAHLTVAAARVFAE